MPDISGILDQLGTAQYFSIFALASHIHQLELDPKDRQKTAFSLLNGHYEYVRMPMGLKNSPATFQNLMDQVLLLHPSNFKFSNCPCARAARHTPRRAFKYDSVPMINYHMERVAVRIR